MAAYMAYTEALTKAGMLQGRRTAYTRARRRRPCASPNGKSQVLDGPYADSKEQLGGYYIIEVPDLDAAISWAARCPASSHGVGRGAAALRPCRR